MVFTSVVLFFCNTYKRFQFVLFALLLKTGDPMMLPAAMSFHVLSNLLLTVMKLFDDVESIINDSNYN
jgi:hypothetical protein